MSSAFADRTAHVQLARSKEETEERRKANQERRAALKATKAQEKKEKTLAEGGVIGESEGDAKPKRRRGDRVRVHQLEKCGIEAEALPATTCTWGG